MSEPIIHCPGPWLSEPCGRYTQRDNAIRSTGDKAWRVVSPDGHPSFVTHLVCPACFRARAKSRVRAALLNGARLDTGGLSTAEREAAEEVLGAELLAVVDGGWDSDGRGVD